MKKLHELLGCKITKDPHVGIEIEAEGGNIQCVDTAYWRSEDDQSLRGRFPDERHEFVSRVLKAHAISNALDELIDKQKGAKFDFSFRTSTHVHVNCTDMELSVSKMFTILSPAFLFTPITLTLLDPTLMILLTGSSPSKSASATAFPMTATGVEV